MLELTRHPGRQRRTKGFTLIELMVTIAVAAILLMVAVPSLTTFKRNAELVSATNTLIASINTARSEAMKRSVNAGVAPVTGSDWNSGVRVFVDANMNNSFDAGELDLSQLDAAGAPMKPPSYITITPSATTTFIGFTAAGYLSGSTLTTLSIARTDVASTDSSQIRRIKIGLTGRVRSCTPKNDKDTACAPKDTTDD